MNTKQRDAIRQRWSGAIRRETRDVASLEQVGARALADSDVRDDPTLQAMIGSDVAHRRAELEHELQSEKSSASAEALRSGVRARLPEPAPATQPEQPSIEFNQLALDLCKSLERNDEGETVVILGKMHAIHGRHPTVIPAETMVDCERRVEALRARIQHLRAEVAALSEQAVAAACAGREGNVERAMCRLTAIHTAHYPLLDDATIEQVRVNVVRAADERHQTQFAARNLVDRGRAITAEIKKLAASVHGFHRAACTLPETSDEFRNAEAAYLRTIEQVRLHDTEWFSGVVLELADLLAEWTLAPPGTEGRIDRFLDSISQGLRTIRAEMREIESEEGR